MILSQRHNRDVFSFQLTDRANASHAHAPTSLIFFSGQGIAGCLPRENLDLWRRTTLPNPIPARIRPVWTSTRCPTSGKLLNWINTQVVCASNSEDSRFLRLPSKSGASWGDVRIRRIASQSTGRNVCRTSVWFQASFSSRRSETHLILHLPRLVTGRRERNSLCSSKNVVVLVFIKTRLQPQIFQSERLVE